ncbi:MAG TPA: hypothetical protein VE244_05305 [Nitrososphaeraceae archaeon]|jgi:hypothetical protein|nr:hypothetical protein [Nitrososphaeraceae archaeon]
MCTYFQSKKAKQQQQEQNLGRERKSTNDYIRKNERIHYVDDDDY